MFHFWQGLQVLGVHFATFWILSGICAWLDLFSPWNRFRRQKLPPVTPTKYGEVVRRVAWIQFRVFPLVWIVFSSLWTPDDLFWFSSWIQLAWHLLVNVILYEIGFYYLHYWLHQCPFLYRTIHKKHHEWTAPVGVASLDAHVLEILIVNYLPFMFGPVLCHEPVVTVMCWAMIASISAVTSHSGYLHWVGFPNHDLHHQFLDVHFGVMGWLDYLRGTHKSLASSRKKLS